MPTLDSLLIAPEFADALYRQYAADPSSVPPDVAALFSELKARRIAAATAPMPAGAPALPRFLTEEGGLPEGVVKADVATGIQIDDLIHTYRQFGHMAADIDPLGASPRSHASLDLSQFDLTEADLDEVVSCVGFHGADRATVRDILAILQETYCGPVGVEYMDVTDKAQRGGLQSRMEPVRNRPHLPPERKRQLLRDLIAADTFEEQLQRMYPGAKRFSLEGGTTLITLLRTLTGEAAETGVGQLVIGMAHRGRLNVLDHPETVMLVSQLALAFRQTLHVDVVIDLVCFRRYGHNELDDASFTQPVMAKMIERHLSVSRIYGDKLVRAGAIGQDDVHRMVEEVKFQPVMDDGGVPDGERADVRRALLCSGRIYYRLLEEREKRGLSPAQVPLLRLEQLYPYPKADLQQVLATYPALERLAWVQEPRNMGAWRNLLHRFEASLPSGVALEYVGRDSRAVPATGSFEVHQQEEAAILEAALAPPPAGSEARPRSVA